MEKIDKIGFIGGGNMAEAIIKGLIGGAFPVARLLVAEPSDERRRLLEDRYGVHVISDNRELVRDCDLLVLAVKPQVREAALAGLAELFTDDKLLISILAGVGTSELERLLSGPRRIIRAMPNTPALVGAGATALCPGRHARPADLRTAQHLFETTGIVQLVEEGQMDAVTGLSGSGPAYVFTIIEALADGGVLQGLPRHTALMLATQTLLGAARMVKESGEHPAVLRDKVCSPGGTTIAAVQALEEGGLRATLMEAVARATERSRELGG
ncbi:pyrroline-5-carboxylate reductase [Trichloromonas acetexigens]|jgi:pyrroline-5-carboxylate reductase|uniref:Pyrroline-5-carboxylate reductase n=1 Tax=Trichloromonas acetexigens TaxID=38815 RepID=A0A550JGU9_9BACT|nr:pyrroline-5-carboxylate reductase [Desulfuromonas acetexigens]TRO82446.1 pyrroline-5-carboxylate reductase [Desulfuromonas acetexigens]